MNKKINLCFDFDGPIVDVIDRYYRAYLESLKGFENKKVQILSKEDFWKLKQNRVSDLEIGLMSSLSINESTSSSEIRRDLTFKAEYLSHDRLFNDVFTTFDYLKSNKITFFLVTLRRYKQLNYAIKQFKLEKYFSVANTFSLPDEHKFTNDIQEKYLMLVNALNKIDVISQETWIITDSDTDIHASRLARYGKVIAIPRGIRSKEQLEVLKPDFIINDLKEIIILIQNQS